MEEKKCVGSIWNVNNWHWEQKNYTLIAKKLLSEEIKKILLQEGETKISHSEILKVDGEAEIHNRKGKQVLYFDLSAEVEWTAISKYDVAEGSYKVVEINSDDMDFRIENVKPEENTEYGKQVCNIIKKQMKNKYIELLKKFPEQLAMYESDPQKLEEDKKKREEAQIATQKAREENGEEKDRIFKEQKEKEQKMKEEFAKLNQNTEKK